MFVFLYILQHTTKGNLLKLLMASLRQDFVNYQKNNSYRVVALPTAKKTFRGKDEIYGQNTNITSFFRVYSNPIFEFTCIGLCATLCSGVTLYLSGAVT